MVWSIDSVPDQSGRIALITGANSGLGFDTARALLQKNATVILGCRSIKKAIEASERLLSRTDCGIIELLEIDLSDLIQVNKAADQVESRFKKLDLLINNAGVMAPPRTFSKQGLELQFAVNHLSHMALTLKLLPLMNYQSDARVVTVTSGAQYMGKINWSDLQGEDNYDPWASYSQSKLANVMFAMELDQRLKESDIDIASLSAHPGLAKTNLQPTTIAANGSWQASIVYKIMSPIFQSSSMGALPQLLAATDPNAKSGEQYGPRFNLRGYPRLCEIASLALDKKARERLWKASEKIIEDKVNFKRTKEILSRKK